jgi:hypothetical protein
MIAIIDRPQTMKMTVICKKMIVICNSHSIERVASRGAIQNPSVKDLAFAARCVTS